MDSWEGRFQRSVVPSTYASRREVFQDLAHSRYSNWPVYDSTPLNDRSSLDGLKEDIRTVASEWFNHDAHDSVAGFVCDYPLEYVDFEPHDRYSGSTQ